MTQFVVILNEPIMIIKTLEEKLDYEERTESQKCAVFKQILEDLNYCNDDTITGNSNQAKEDSTEAWWHYNYNCWWKWSTKHR